MSPDIRPSHKYRQVYDTVRERILRGTIPPGDRVPPDAVLVKEFGCSRPTVAKAMEELARDGLVRRQSGAGTFVLDIGGQGMSFGLLISSFDECEIFEPICTQLAHISQEFGHGLLWSATRMGGELDKEDVCLKLCEQYVREKVDGVFFAPLEHTPNKDRINKQITRMLTEQKIPIVLLDRDFVPYPNRSDYDLVGVDNRRIGYMITDHLFQRKCRTVMFASRAYQAGWLDGRIAGFTEAVIKQHGLFDPELVQPLDPSDEKHLKRVLDKLKPDGIVCANDLMAGVLLHSLANLNYHVPDDVLVAGIDDVKYASLLRVPLTSVQQPCEAIGNAAFQTMLHRKKFPHDPPRDIALGCRIVERKSTETPTMRRTR